MTHKFDRGLFVQKISRLWPARLQAQDISYGSNPSMLVDVYGRKTNKLKPVILFWHGGSWSYGSKDYYRILAAELQKLDAVVVMVGYPKYPQQTFPGFIDDAMLAAKWTKNNIKKYGGDPKRVYAMGHSSGAHQAAISTLQDDRDLFAGCITLALPCTISKKHWYKVFGDAFDKELQNPITHIGSNKHKYLVIHGKNDKVVRFSDSQKFHESLQSKGYESELILVDRLVHPAILGTLIRPFSYAFTVRKAIKSFIHEL